MDASRSAPAAADRLTARVRAMHRRVTGELAEAGGPVPGRHAVPRRRPELLLWILAALAESAMLVYGKYVRSLSRDELDALWRDYRVVGRPLRAARARHAARHRRPSRPTWPRMYASGDLLRHAAGARAGASTSSCTRRCRSRPAAAGRAGQPDHGRPAAAAACAASTGSVGPGARGRVARRRGVRQARWPCYPRFQLGWMGVGRRFASMTGRRPRRPAPRSTARRRARGRR